MSFESCRGRSCRGQRLGTGCVYTRTLACVQALWADSTSTFLVPVSHGAPLFSKPASRVPPHASLPLLQPRAFLSIRVVPCFPPAAPAGCPASIPSLPLPLPPPALVSFLPAFPPELNSDVTSCGKPTLASTAVPPQSGPTLCYVLSVSSSLVPPSTVVANERINHITAPHCLSPLLEGKSPKGRG